MARLFPETYEALDPGCTLVAEHPRTGRLMGSCFHHPRETHVSLGIMNVHPAYFGMGVARRLLRAITDDADARGLPVRLVSSAFNLDSYSLYTRAGFVPEPGSTQHMVRGGKTLQEVRYHAALTSGEKPPVMISP